MDQKLFINSFMMLQERITALPLPNEPQLTPPENNAVEDKEGETYVKDMQIKELR